MEERSLFFLKLMRKGSLNSPRKGKVVGVLGGRGERKSSLSVRGRKGHHVREGDRFPRACTQTLFSEGRALYCRVGEKDAPISRGKGNRDKKKEMKIDIFLISARESRSLLRNGPTRAREGTKP